MTDTTTGSTTLARFGEFADGLMPGSPEFREQVERGAGELARVFDECTRRMRMAWAEFSEQCDILDEFISPIQEGTYRSRNFDVGLYYDGSREYDYREKGAIDRIIGKMNVKVWELLITRLGVKNLMSIKRRAEFEKQIKDGDVPEVNEANILGVLLGLADRASEFATEAAKEALKLLTPASAHYRTNSGFKVGRRVILSYCVESAYESGRFRANHYREPELIAIDGAFHVLDEKGVIRGHRCPLILAINEAAGGRGETEYFSFRCFKNRNLHIEFKRLDLVKKLNGLATGEYVLGKDAE